jgi:hypothetical protein
MLIIPVAIVAAGAAGAQHGLGAVTSLPAPMTRPGRTPRLTTPHRKDSGRTEAGGGFGGLVLPSGAYVVKGDQVRWVPAVDVTIAMLASLSLVRVLARAWSRQLRRRGRL